MGASENKEQWQAAGDPPRQQEDTSTHCSCGTIPELSEAGVAGVMGVMGVMGEGYRGVVPGKGAVVRVCEWKSCGVCPEAP